MNKIKSSNSFGKCRQTNEIKNISVANYFYNLVSKSVLNIKNYQK